MNKTIYVTEEYYTPRELTKEMFEALDERGICWKTKKEAKEYGNLDLRDIKPRKYRITVTFERLPA